MILFLFIVVPISTWQTLEESSRWPLLVFIYILACSRFIDEGMILGILYVFLIVKFAEYFA